MKIGRSFNLVTSYVKPRLMQRMKIQDVELEAYHTEKRITNHRSVKRKAKRANGILRSKAIDTFSQLDPKTSTDPDSKMLSTSQNLSFDLIKPKRTPYSGNPKEEKGWHGNRSDQICSAAME